MLKSIKIIQLLILLVCFVNISKAQRNLEQDTLRTYLGKLILSSQMSDKKLLDDKIKTLTQSNVEAEVLSAVSALYQLGKTDSARALLKTVQARFPSGNQARGIALSKLNNFKDAQTAENAYSDFIAKFPPKSKENPSAEESTSYDGLRSLVAHKFAEEKNLNKASEYLNLIQVRASRLNTLVELATIFYQKDDLVHAEIFAKQRLQNALTDEGNRKVKQGEKSRYIDFSIYFSKFLLQKQKYQEAYQMLLPAYQRQEGIYPDLNKVYAQALLGLKKDQQAYQVLKPLFLAGQLDHASEAQFKALSVKLKISQKVYDSYVATAKNNAVKSLKDKLNNSIINTVAPAFNLSDLNGKRISLSDYKGKIVILDFWATWCVPCKASFPAMQQAINDYKDDNNVVFLFIHTFPRAINPKEDASRYLKDSGYTFNVLMDEVNPKNNQLMAVNAYGVNSIPAKFIIDGLGNIRFRLTGFEGNTQTAVEEIKMMVDMIK